MGNSKGKAEGKGDLEAAASRKAKNERQHSFQEKQQKVQPIPGTIPGPRTQVLIIWGLNASSRSQTINKHESTRWY